MRASAVEAASVPPVARPHGPPPASDLSPRWSAVSLAAAILVGIAVSFLRCRPHSVDIWFDDSYVVMSTRVPLSSIRLVSVGAPGFTVLARWWLGLRPGSVSWAQSVGLFGFVASPIVLFVAARTAGAARWAATTTACMTALAPMLLTESARVKQYTLEFALSAAMVGLAAAIRRDGPAMRWTAAAAGLLLVGAFISGAMLLAGTVLYAVMLTSVTTAVRDRAQSLSVSEAARRLAVPATAGVIVVAWSAVFIFHPSSDLQASWRDYGGYLGSTGAPGATARQAISILRGFFGAFVAGGATPLLVVPVVALTWFVLRRWRSVWWLLLAPVLAVITSVAQTYPLGPLGRGRVDAWLMPWVAVLVALTFAELGDLPSVRSFVARVPRWLAAAMLAVIALALVLGSVKQTVPYPPTRARDALRTISPYRSTGFAYVDVHDLPVDLVTPGPVRVLENYEVRLSGGYQGINGYDPVAAAHELDRACGTIAAIVGVDPQILAKALAHVDCQVVGKKVNRFHTAQVWDDTVILRLGPRAPRG